jgi:phosphotransferase system HPr-like phosphotransfer protein
VGFFRPRDSRGRGRGTEDKEILLKSCSNLADSGARGGACVDLRSEGEVEEEEVEEIFPFAFLL